MADDSISEFKFLMAMSPEICGWNPMDDNEIPKHVVNNVELLGIHRYMR
jgi:hypothetical protein